MPHLLSPTTSAGGSMAPSKRAAPVDDDDDGEVEAVHVTDGRVRISEGHRSKRRASGEHAHHYDPATDEDLVDRSRRSRRGTSEFDFTLNPSTQFEELRDTNDNDSEDEAEDDAEAVQALLSRNGTLGENRPADNGVIQSIEVVNFMCHERLHVTLGPLINFIIGMNGSGKSAVLTAITLCLGGKASATNRGGSLKKFIKEGRDAATLIIKLKNGGVDAYQPHVYGDSIIVERHFSKQGSSGFKLKSSNGRIISTRRQDVDDMIDYFQMQIDNPMSVLSQDDARQFLNSSTAAQKYKFFFKGVQLEQLDNDYKLIHESTELTRVKLTEATENLEVLRTKKEQAELKLRLVENHKNMKQEYRNLRHKHAWAQVRDVERQLNEYLAQVAEAQNDIEAAEQIAEQKSQAFEHVEQLLQEAESAKEERQAEINALVEDETLAKAKSDEAAAKVRDLHTQQREVGAFIKTTEAKIAGYTQDIETEKQRIERATGGALTDLLEAIQEAEQDATSAAAAVDESTARAEVLKQQLMEAARQASEAKAPVEAKRNEIKQAENHLQSLNRDRGESMTGFDPSMGRLLKAIQQDRGFREKPVGPLGQHIKLLKPEWSMVLEKTIGNILGGFIVTSKADRARLADLASKNGMPNVQILIGKNEPLDTTGNEPDPEYLTILRALEIDHPMVRRELIILQAMEQQLLIRDHAEATRVMFTGARPRNVKACLTFHKTAHNFGRRLTWSGNDPFEQPVPFQTNGKPRMKTDIDSQIQNQRRYLEQLQRELSGLEREKRELDQIAQKCKTALELHKQKHSQLIVARQTAEEKVDRLKVERDNANIEDGRLEEFQDLLKEAQAECLHFKNQWMDLSNAKEPINKEAAALKRALNAAKDALADQQRKVEKAQRRVVALGQARASALVEKNAAYDNIETAKHVKDRAEQKAAQHEKYVTEFRNGASEIAPTRIEVPDNETPDSIFTKMKSMKKDLDQYSRNLGATDEEIKQMAHAALDNYNKVRRHIRDLYVLLDHFDQTLADRLTRWREFRRRISARARMNFMYLLSERGFRGKLTLDHKQKLLELHVEPDSTTTNSKGRQTKTLSGGEKSFSSICLLLALWEAMGSPLRCLDEFDVFMDNVNRDISSNMIVTAARRSVGRQFILITPNSIGNIEHNQDVKVSKLVDPRQRRLADH